jgi:branched-chain amino acid transport system substrate-binding protein
MKAKFWIFFLVVLSVIIFLAFTARKHFDDDALYLAVAGPLKTNNGEAILQGIELYLDQINRRGGITGKKVKLLLFDDENNKVKAKEHAKKIVDSKAVAVIGHYSSSTSLAAGPIYQQQGLAAITGSATANEVTENNDWYFRVIFNNGDQSAVLANYARKILGHKKAYIFFDEDAYGKTLASTFAQTAKRIGLSIEHQWGFNSDESTSFDNKFKEMLETLAQEDEYGILFLATHSTEAIKTIAGLRRLERKIPMMGADALASRNFMTKFKKEYPQEKNFPGYYTDGIYITSPFLIDIAGKRAQDFKYEFLKNNYPEESIVTSAMYYDATMVALEAVRKTLEARKTASLKETRERVKDQLWQLSNAVDAVEGVTGDLYFDKNGDAIKSIPIAVYKKGKPIVTMEQYLPVTSLRNTDNLLQDILDNKIIQVSGKFMHKAQVVYVGIDFNDISELNTADSTYTADFYLWFRFKDDKTTETKGFDKISFVNIFEPENDLTNKDEYFFDEKRSYLEEGVITRTYRVKTQFKGDFDFHDYPLDKQVLPLQFQHKKLTKDQLIYVVDVLGMKDPVKLVRAEGNKFFSIGGWKMNELSFFQNSQKVDSTLGIPELFDSQQRIEYSRFNVNIEIDRHVLNFIVKNLLATIFIIVLGYVVYFTTDYGLRMSLNINMILATSLFHLQLASVLVAIDYNVLIEYVFYMVYMLAVLGIVATLYIHKKEGDINKTENSLEKIKAAKKTESAGEGEEAKTLDKELNQLEESISNDQLLIKRIVSTGQVGYPVVIIVTIIVITQSKWLPYLQNF